MESQADKVTHWGAELQVLKVREQKEGTSSALDERIAILERRLFDAEQQGKFASLITMSSFPIPNDNILLPDHFRHLLFTHPAAANAQGKR
jgi:hypothetical protein